MVSGTCVRLGCRGDQSPSSQRELQTAVESFSGLISVAIQATRLLWLVRLASALVAMVTKAEASPTNHKSLVDSCHGDSPKPNKPLARPWLNNPPNQLLCLVQWFLINPPPLYPPNLLSSAISQYSGPSLSGLHLSGGSDYPDTKFPGIAICTLAIWP